MKVFIVIMLVLVLFCVAWAISELITRKEKEFREAQQLAMREAALWLAEQAQKNATMRREQEARRRKIEEASGEQGVL